MSSYPNLSALFRRRERVETLDLGAVGSPLLPPDRQGAPLVLEAPLRALVDRVRLVRLTPLHTPAPVTGEALLPVWRADLCVVRGRVLPRTVARQAVRVLRSLLAA